MTKAELYQVSPHNSMCPAAPNEAGQLIMDPMSIAIHLKFLITPVFVPQSEV